MDHLFKSGTRPGGAGNPRLGVERSERGSDVERDADQDADDAEHDAGRRHSVADQPTAAPADLASGRSSPKTSATIAGIAGEAQHDADDAEHDGGNGLAGIARPHLAPTTSARPAGRPSRVRGRRTGRRAAAEAGGRRSRPSTLGPPLRVPAVRRGQPVADRHAGNAHALTVAVGLGPERTRAVERDERRDDAVVRLFTCHLAGVGVRLRSRRSRLGA